MPSKIYIFLVITFFTLLSYQCEAQSGPDPWNYEVKRPSSEVDNDRNIPPDLRLNRKKKTESTENSYGMGEWFYRRLLSIVLKSGEVKSEEGTVDISLQMKLDENEWKTLDEYMQSSSPLSEEKLRRSLGYVEQSIYKPSVVTKVILSWIDYIQMYIINYKSEITWSFALLAVCGLAFFLWTRMSHRQAIIIIMILCYAYEVVISYKEAEKKEIETFMAAINQCSGYFWSTKCEAPKPDPLIFMKHMNPAKIGIRMFTTLVSEPMIALSDIMKTMTHGMTDGLWPPFNIIFYGVLITFSHILLIFFIIMIVFNFILNIPFKLNVFGLLSIVLPQRNRNVFGDRNDREPPPPRVENNVNNVIDNNVIHRLLDVVARALDNRPNQIQNAVQFRVENVPNGRQLPRVPQAIRNNREMPNVPQVAIKQTPNPGMRRSASTGRLPNFGAYQEVIGPENAVRRRNVHMDGGGDAPRI